MLIIGVTGPIAAGKSTVDTLLRDMGASPVIDADVVVHELYATSLPLQEALIDLFGSTIRASDGTINRQALSACVFGNPDALRQLENIVHPVVRAAVQERLQAAPTQSIAVIDAVKLLPSPLAALCTQRWWVSTDPSQQRQRLMERGLRPDDIERRLAAQPRLEDWQDQIDLIIDNSGSLDGTRHQVKAAWQALT